MLQISPLRDFLSSGFLASLTSLFELLQRIVSFVESRRLQGIYDVLEQERTVTILDASGHVATVDTVQRVRFRQNHVTALTEYAWGEGELWAEYRCTPGVPVDSYAEGSRQVILISLREHKNVGDELCLRSHRLVREGFTRSEEYWESDVYHRTGSIKVRIIFPKERQCQRATVTVRSTGKTVALGPECYQALPDGRQALCWIKDKPSLNERYLLSWIW